MRLFKSASSIAFFFSTVGLFLCAGGVAAQEKPATPDRSSAPSSRRPVPSKKQRANVEPDEEQESSAFSESANDADGPEAIRKREEWFYKQRSSVSGHIPSGARLKAFQHMQRMMVREGKLTLRPDGSYAEIAPQSWLSPLSAVSSAWASVGPTPASGGFFSPVTGRVMTIAVDPSDSSGNTVLLGGAMGGIWRSTDAGAHWNAVGDQNASLAMGSIAFSPSNHSIVYAGTGEQALAFDTYYGVGVLKSTDGGLHWKQTCTVASSTCPFIGPYTDGTEFGPGFGFLNFGGAHISYVAVSPSNSNLILAGVQFIVEGPKEGVYCSDNGGSTWSNILPDEMATFVGFGSSSVAYAALGNPFASGPGAPNGNGIYKATSIGSTCGSIHFSRLTSTSLPAQSTMGRIDLGIAPSDTTGSTVYASIADANSGSAFNLGVYVTTNGGTSWTKTSAPDICKFQCWYDNVVKVDPNNRDIAFFGGSAVRDSNGNFTWVVRTQNRGTTWSSVIPNLPPGSAGLPHVDNHAIAFFKATSGTFAGKVRMYLGNDGGIWRTDDAEASTVTWINLNNPTLTLTQFYPSISVNPSTPSIAFGGTQDNGSLNYQGGTSWLDNNLCGDGASSAVDFQIPSTVYIGCATGAPINASYQNGAIGTFFPAINGINLSDYSSFIPPLATDPNAANLLYYGTTRVYQSIDAGNTWNPISGDLAYGPTGGWLNSITVAPANSSVVYAGANTGGVFIATNVTPGGGGSGFGQVNLFQLPPRSVSAIAVDPADASGKSAYVAFSGFAFVGNDPFNISINDPLGHIFKTIDGGNNWTDVSCSTTNCSAPAATDLPNVPVNDIVIDPDVPNTLYAATDLGVFIGNCSSMPCTWSTVGTGLPRTAVLSLRLHEASRTLRAATHGRGAWDIFLNNLSFSGPRLFSLSPVSANAGGTQFTLTVNGTSLTGGAIQWNGSTSGTTMLAGGTDTALSATIAPSLLIAGTPKVTVKVGTTTSNSLTFPVLAAVPTLTSINPSSTPVQTPNPNTPVQIQLTGTNFSSNVKVLFNGAQSGITVAAPTASCPLPTCFTATLPAALLGPYGSTNDIAVLNTPPGGGQSQTLTFKVVAPPPPNDSFASATNITAFSFADVQDSSGATTESNDPTPPCATQIAPAQGNNGGHPNGAYNTIWYKFTPPVSANLNLDTQGSSYDSVLSIWTGTQGSLTNIACNDDINPGTVLASQLQNVPLTAGTTYYIMVSSFGPPNPNPIALGGATSFHFFFTGLYPAPTLSSISPTSANSGDSDLTITLTGSNFFAGAGVQFIDSKTSYGNALATTFVSSTQLTAIVPASAIILPGSFLVSVNNPFPNNGPSASLPFTVNLGVYPVPTLSYIYPTTVVAGSVPFTINATGTNFASTAVLNFNGVAKPTTVFYPQNLYGEISTADISTPGTVQVTVSNPSPGGGTSAPQQFTITQPTVVPTITSTSPSPITANVPTDLTVNGSGFLQGASLFVSVRGQYWPANVSSATQLLVPGFYIVFPGIYQIFVVDPSPAGTSSAFSITVTAPPPPTITTVSPSSGQSGSSVPITITGTGFQQGATVSFNGTNYGTTVSSSTQLATVLQLAGVAAGTYPLSVVDPAPTGASAPFDFNVTDFSITSGGTTTQTVTAGQTATFANAVSVTAQNGFASQVNLVCSLPVAAKATTCTVNPNSIPSGGGTASVSVTTTAHGLLPPSTPTNRFRLPPQWVPILLLSVLLAVLILRFARTRRQRLATIVPLALLVFFLGLQALGCGGGSSYTPPPPTGTPAGTYTVTVTGAASTNNGTLTHTTTLTLTVN